MQGAWFMEFQKRGAPHFNILLGNGLEGSELRHWWHELVGKDDPAHAHGCGFYMEEIKSWEKVCGYLVAELCKRQQKTVPKGFENGVGRWWGKWGIAKMRPCCTLKGAQAIAAARLVRKAVNADRRARCWAQPRNFGDGELRNDDPSTIELHRVVSKICKHGGRIPNLERFLQRGYRKVRDNGRASRRIWDGAKWCKMFAPPPGVPGSSGVAPGAGASP